MEITICRECSKVLGCNVGEDLHCKQCNLHGTKFCHLTLLGRRYNKIFSKCENCAGASNDLYVFN